MQGVTQSKAQRPVQNEPIPESTWFKHITLQGFLKKNITDQNQYSQ